MACTYTFEGNTYTEQQFLAFISQNIDRLQQEYNISPTSFQVGDNTTATQNQTAVSTILDPLSIKEYKSTLSSLPLRDGKMVEYKDAVQFSESIRILMERFGIDVYLTELNKEQELNIFGSTGPLGNYDSINNRININKDEKIYEGVIVHEFIHAFSRLMQTYNKNAFRTLVDRHYERLGDLDTVRALWRIAVDYGNLDTIPSSLEDLPEGSSKDLIYDEIFTRLIEREYNENGSIEDFKKSSNIFYQIFEWVKNFLGVKYNRKKEFSKLTTSSSVKDFYNLLKKVDSLKVTKEEYLKSSPYTHESIYNVHSVLKGRNYQDLSKSEQDLVRAEMFRYNEYMKNLPKMELINFSNVNDNVRPEAVVTQNQTAASTILNQLSKTGLASKVVEATTEEINKYLSDLGITEESTQNELSEKGVALIPKGFVYNTTISNLDILNKMIEENYIEKIC